MCLDEILKIEGTYVDDETDTGGETYRGISRKWHPKWNGWIMIDSYKDTNSVDLLKKGVSDLDMLAKTFYQNEYVEKINYDFLSTIDNELACMVLDSAINMGITTTIKILQEAINKTYTQFLENKKINVDGDMGNQTKNRLIEIKDNMLDVDILDYFMRYRALYYADIVANNPSQIKFIRGWIKRALKI